ncbi:MAG TPA: GNAT family N-acetyltransferase [Fimbriimonadaceae bacterium]|jgi:ribosomal protein S18 acetylase RimI-like enzyme
MTVSARSATAEDDTFLFEVFCSSRADLSLLPDEVRGPILEMQFKAKQAQYASSFPDANQSILVFEEKPVGTTLVNEDTELRLVDIAILPEFRNRGIGTAFIQQLCLSGKAITLHVAHGNPAENLYRRLGFQEIQRDDVYIEMRRPSGLVI